MQPAPGTESPRVLLANAGAPDHARILALLTSAARLEVRAISVDALKAGEFERPDCILIEEGSGSAAAIENLRLKWSSWPPALIVLGDRDSSQAAMDAVRAGAQDFLPRPGLTPEVLLAAIRRALTHAAHEAAERTQLAQRLSPGELLTESEATVRALFEHASQGILMADIHGLIVQANAMIEELFGYTRAELLGRPVEMLLPARFRSGHVHHRALYVAAPRPRPMGVSQELAALRKDGSEFPVEISLSHIETKFGGLAVAFLNDITIRKHAESALRENEARFQAFMDNSPALKFIKDERGNVVWINRAYERFFRTADRFTTVSGHALTLAAERKIAEAQQAAPPDAALEILETACDEAGQEHHFLSFKFNFLGAANQEMLGGILIDVTEGQRAQEETRIALFEKTVLRKEVHHRVKNNLAIVSSLLAMQAEIAGGSTARALSDSQYRIQSMALVHKCLYGSEQLDRINFKDYANRLASEIALRFDLSARDVELRVEAEPVEIGLDSAIPCALILNELISNAAKYAFPAGRKGEVLVDIRRPERGLLSLAVADNGVGLPEGFHWRNADSPGLRIVQLLTNQLDGAITLVPGAGTRFELILPQGEIL